MRVLDLGLSIVTFLTVVWTIILCTVPIGPVDRFDGVHQLERHDVVGAERGTELMRPISATFAQQSRWIALAVDVPLSFTKFGWLAMFVTKIQTRD